MRNENQLLENKQMREECVGRIEVLNKVKELLLLPNTDFATTEMVANYYECPIDTIGSVIKNNRDELTTNGLTNVSGEQLKSIKDLSGLKSRSRSLALFTKRAILNVGMLLRDSLVAREIRTQLLNGFDNAVDDGKVELFTRDIDEEMKLNLELAQAFASGDQTKMLIASQNLNNFKNRKIKELEDENGKLRIFLGDSEIFTKTSLANKLDTHPTTMSKVLKEENIYTKTCKVSENFKSKFPNIKIIQETKEDYRDKDGIKHTKTDWQWTKQGAFELTKYLLDRKRIVETENNQYKLCKN